MQNLVALSTLLRAQAHAQTHTSPPCGKPAEATKAVRWPESNLRLPAIATGLHLCYTHASLQKRHTERGKREGGRHMRNICLLKSRWAPQRIWKRIGLGWGGGINEGVCETKGGQRGAAPRCQRPDSSCCHILSLIRQVSSSCTQHAGPASPRLASSHCSGGGERKRSCGNLESAEPKQITSKRLI